MLSIRIPRLVPLFAVIILAAAFAGCKKDEAEAEPDVNSLTLMVGSQSVTVSNNGTVTGGPILITRPATPTITATFKNSAGVMDPIAHGGNFQMNVTSANTGLLTFTRTSAFVGTLSTTATGSTQITISLFHIAEGHDDFGPFPVPVTIN